MHFHVFLSVFGYFVLEWGMDKWWYMFPWYVITHPCLNFNLSFAKFTSKLGYGWIITSSGVTYMGSFIHTLMLSQIAKLMQSTWGPPGSCRPQMGPMLAPWTLLSGIVCPLRLFWACDSETGIYLYVLWQLYVSQPIPSVAITCVWLVWYCHT